MNYFCFYFRENGLSDICDLLEEAKDARMEEEKKSELRRSLLEKIPECPVNIKFYFAISGKFPQCFISQVCLNQFQKDRPVYSCPVGHHICGVCKVKIQVRNTFRSSSVLTQSCLGLS